MKRFFAVLGLVSLLCVVSCDKDKKDDGTIDVPTLENSNLTPGQHQQKLEDIAIEFVNYINPADTEEIIMTMMRLSEYIEYGEFPEYYAGMIDAVIDAAGFSAMGVVDFATRATSEEFIIDINDSEINPYAGTCFVFDDGSYEWYTRDIEKNKIRAEWDDTVAEVVWDTNNFIYRYDYVEEDVTYVVYVPNKISFQLIIGNVKHIEIVVEPGIKDMYTYASRVSFNIHGGYNYTASLDADSYGVKGVVTMSKSGKLLAAAKIAIEVNDATDPDNWVYEEHYTWSDGYEETWTYIDPAYYIGEQAKSGEVQMDVLSLTIYGAGAIRDIVSAVERIEEDYDDESKRYAEEICEVVNSKAKALLFYNDKNEKVADIVMQASRDEYYGDVYYYPEPILLFPDGSKFAFESYFTAERFSSLIDAVEELVEEFEYMFE